MSGIPTLRDYVAKAELSSSGEIRGSRDDQNQLVNKGTLRQRIVTFFRSIGEALGFAKPENIHVKNDRIERQEKALNGFRQSLIDTFGEDLGQKAFLIGGTRSGDEELTGNRVMHSMGYVEDVVRLNTTTNRSHVAGGQPPERGLRGHHLQAVAKELNVDLKRMTQEQLHDYTKAFDEAMETARKNDSVKLSDKEVRDIVRQALERVGLDDLPRIPGDERVRDAMGRTYVDLKNEIQVNVPFDRSQRGKTTDPKLPEGFRGLSEMVRRYFDEAVELPKGDKQMLEDVVDRARREIGDLIEGLGGRPESGQDMLERGLRKAWSF